MYLRKWVKPILICLFWYASSSVNNVVGKHLLTRYPHPMTLTLVQLLSITLYSIPLLRTLDKENPLTIEVPTRTWYKYVVPLAIGKFLASVSSHWSIWKVPVSYAHTVKATMPLFTVALTKLLFPDTHYTKAIYISLIPIITGVAIASASELNFNIVGLISALLSTLAFSLQNIFSKELLKTTKIHHYQLLFLLARLSLMFYTPLYLIFDLNLEIFEPTIFGLLVLDGVLSFLQNVLAFSFLNLVSPLTYSVANALKRVFIICLSILVFGNKVGLVNVLGMGLAVFGVFAYNRAKSEEKKSRGKVGYLPLVLNNNNYI